MASGLLKKKDNITSTKVTKTIDSDILGAPNSNISNTGVMNKSGTSGSSALNPTITTGGSLNEKKIFIEYQGGETDTAKVTVDNTDRIITADLSDELEKKLDDIQEDITEVRQEMSIVSKQSAEATAKVNQMSIIVDNMSQQMTVLNNKVVQVENRMSIIENKFDNKLDKDLSILPTTQPKTLAIESRQNLEVYLYNTATGEGRRAKITELGLNDIWNESDIDKAADGDLLIN